VDRLDNAKANVVGKNTVWFGMRATQAGTLALYIAAGNPDSSITIAVQRQRLS
jgi:hypothetical protein